MSQQEVKAQEAGEERLWPAVVLVAGLITWLISMVGALTSQFWAEYYGLPWAPLSTAALIALGAGTVVTLYGCHVCWGPAEDKPDPLGGIEREIAGLRQEVAALRLRLEDGA